MTYLKKTLGVLALALLGLVLAGCDAIGEAGITCKGQVHVNIVGIDQVAVAEIVVAPDQIGAALRALSDACGGGVIVVVGSEDRAYRETVVKVFDILDDDPSVSGVGIATEKFLAKKAGKKI